jgi:hypothetical protein
VVFPSLKRGRYFGFRLACYPQGEAEPVGFLALLAPPTLAVPTDLLATRSEPEPHQRLGGRRGVVPPELAEPRRVVVPPSAAIPHRD